MTAKYSNFAEIVTDLPDLVPVLTDFVGLAADISSGNLIAIATSFPKWEQDMVKVINDVKALGASEVTPVTPVVVTSPPAVIVPNAVDRSDDLHLNAVPSMAEMAGVPSAK